MKRITLQVEEDLFDKMTDKLPHGFRNHVLAAVLKLIMDAMDGMDAKAIIGAILAGKFKLVEMEPLDDGR